MAQLMGLAGQKPSFVTSAGTTGRGDNGLGTAIGEGIGAIGTAIGKSGERKWYEDMMKKYGTGGIGAEQPTYSVWDD